MGEIIHWLTQLNSQSKRLLRLKGSTGETACSVIHQTSANCAGHTATTRTTDAHRRPDNGPSARCVRALTSSLITACYGHTFYQLEFKKKTIIFKPKWKSYLLVIGHIVAKQRAALLAFENHTLHCFFPSFVTNPYVILPNFSVKIKWCSKSFECFHIEWKVHYHLIKSSVTGNIRGQESKCPHQLKGVVLAFTHSCDSHSAAPLI